MATDLQFLTRNAGCVSYFPALSVISRPSYPRSRWIERRNYGMPFYVFFSTPSSVLNKSGR